MAVDAPDGESAKDALIKELIAGLAEAESEIRKLQAAIEKLAVEAAPPPAA